MHDAGVHPLPGHVDVRDGQAHIGPLTAAEYERAWRALSAQYAPSDRLARRIDVALPGAGVLLALAVGAGLIAAPLSLAWAPVVFGVVALLALASLTLDALGMAGRARLGRHHPDAGVRAFARSCWWLPWLGVMLIALVVAVLFVLFAM
jgi:hypothetical protein